MCNCYIEEIFPSLYNARGSGDRDIGESTSKTSYGVIGNFSPNFLSVFRDAEVDENLVSIDG